MKTSVLRDKSIAFAIRIAKLCQRIQTKHKEFVLTKQTVRSGTSIGANVHEGAYAQSKPDFIHKLSISLKESVETEYWLFILFKTGYIKDEEYDSLNADCNELKAILIVSIKTARANLNKK